jgi:prephenate dehydrogenase
VTLPTPDVGAHPAPPPPFRAVAVVGLGTIGGSLARDLAAAGVRVLGYDADAETLHAAHAEGVLDAVLPPDLGGVEEADALVIALPVDLAPAALAGVAARAGRLRLVTDVGSTKRGIVRAAEALGLGPRFVGSHPLAGDHRSGWGASRRGLFRDAVVYLCPADGADAGACDAARRLWEGVGARTETLDAAEHDRRLAWTSHLPQVLATSLARTLAGAGYRPSDLGPGGASMTRLAGSSPRMWTGIARENADELAEAVEQCRAQLDGLRDALRHDDEAVHRWFAGGREFGA